MIANNPSTLHSAVYAVYPNAKVVEGNAINELKLFDAEGNSVSYDEATVQAYIDAHAYKEQRAKAYPSFADQFDLLYHGGLDAWKAAIDAVKQEYPKP
jgi:rhodanese-related sulfurtransferase